VFTDTGVGTSFFGPQRVALPDRSYVIGNGSGTLTITVPAHIATVPFRTLDLLGKECDSLWQAYFPNLKSRVGAVDSSLRNMVNDIATRIAKDAVVSGLLPASATGPLDPKDNISLLDALGERVGKAVDDALAYFLESPQAVDALMSNLWNATKALLGDLVDTLAGFYDTLVLAPLQEGFAGDALADDLMAAAANDPDYASLNLAQYIELRGAIASDVVRNAWNRTAYEDRKATDLARWRLALALADGTSQPGAHLRAQIRAEVVGAGGWLWLAGNSVKRLVSEAARGQDLGAGRAIYATRAEPFVVQDPRAPGSNSTEGFRVAHSPAYVSLVPETPNGVGRVGETRVAIVVPADVPPTDDSPNAHFTKFGASSQRPFTTQWTVRVSGTIRLRVETASPILLGPRGLGPAALEEAWPLDFTISFAAYSGWNLTGVRYRPSDTLFSDIVKFLDGALETVFPILRWVLDFFRKGLEILRDLAERISDFATRVVREIGVLFSRLVDILHKLAMQALSIVGSVLDFVRAYLPANLRFSLYVSGIGLDVLANGPSGRALVLGFNLLGRGEITFLRLEDSEYRGRANGATYDVLGAWNASVGALHQDGAFDPLAIVQPRMIQGTASWDRAWHADFAGPEFESRLLFDQSYGFTLFLPEGTEVGGKVGVEVLVAGNPFFDFNAALQRGAAEIYTVSLHSPPPLALVRLVVRVHLVLAGAGGGARPR